MYLLDVRGSCHVRGGDDDVRARACVRACACVCVCVCACVRACVCVHQMGWLTNEFEVVVQVVLVQCKELRPIHPRLRECLPHARMPHSAASGGII